MDDDSRCMLERGRNCWRVERAERVGWVIAGERYFRAVRKALLRAERHAVLLAWDLRSDVSLERGESEPEDGLPREVGPFLNALLEERPDLHLHILLWDFSMIYAAEREWSLFSDFLRDPHPRLHIVFDDTLPLAASHHQKVLVVDDVLAFAGGLDLSAWRWDRVTHPLHDEHRVDPAGKAYGPYHDVQMAVTGPAAVALGDLCAERWKRATGENLPRNDSPPAQPPWPEELETVLESVEVGIARTYAPFEPWPAVNEIERLHLDVIAQARHYLYFENQYFSSRRLAEALMTRLREEDGPEVIIVMMQEAGGWLEQGTMGLMRDRLFEILAEADSHGRLRLYFPQVASDDGGERAEVYVHSKIVIADDRILKVGSSNLSNRSMRVDSEVDLVIEQPKADPAVRKCLHRLLGVHFGVDAKEVAARLERQTRLTEALDAMVTDTGHSLRPFRYGCDSALTRRLAESQLLDPDEPIDPNYWIHNFVPKSERPSVMKRVLMLSGVVLAGVVLAILLKKGWGQVIDRDTVVSFLETLRGNPWTLVILTAAFLVAGMSGFSLNLLLVAATIALGPWTALLCGFAGGMLSALAGFGLGHHLGKPLMRKWASERMDRIDRQLHERGILSVVLVRVLPVAPFVVINLVAGASRLPFRTFFVGTLLGMAPGMTVVVLLTRQVDSAVTNPGWGTISGLAVVVALVAGALALLSRALIPHRTSGENSANQE